MLSHTARVRRSFDLAAKTYAEYASCQHKIGQQLLSMSASLLPRAKWVLDVGCGNGNMLMSLQRQFPTAYIAGVDISHALLREHQAGMMRIQADFNQLPVKQAAIELLISNMALHWSADPITTIQALKQYMMPKGRMVASIPVAGTFAELVHALPEREPFPFLGVEQFGKMLHHVEQYKVHYASASELLRALKYTGTQCHPKPSPSLACGRRVLRALTAYYKQLGTVTLTYQIGYIVI